FYQGEVLAQLRELGPPSMTERLHELGVNDRFISLEWEETIAACLNREPSRRPVSMRAVEMGLFSDRHIASGAPPKIAVAVRKPGRPALAGYALVSAVVVALLGWLIVRMVATSPIKA